MLDGANIQDAAAAAAVHRNTVSKWLSEPLFWTTYQDASKRALKATTQRLAVNMDAALDTLTSVMLDEEAPAGVRLRAAQLVFDSGVRLLDAVELVERLDELESRLAAL